MNPHEPKIFISEKPRRARLWGFLTLAVFIICGVIGIGLMFFREDLYPQTEPAQQIVRVPPTPFSGQLPEELEEVLPPAVTAPGLVQPAAAQITAKPQPLLDEIQDRLQFHFSMLNELEDRSPKKLSPKVSGHLAPGPEGAYFDGSTTLTLPHIPLNNREFSFALFIKPEGTVHGYGLLEQKAEGSRGRHLHFLLRDQDTPRMGYLMNDLATDKRVRSEDGWTHLVFQFKDNRQQIWINGQLVAERRSEPYQGEHGATHIGKAPRWNNVHTESFTGLMRDVRLYDVALSPQQIQLLSTNVVVAPAVTVPGIKNENF